MALARFWYYPDAIGTVEIVTLTQQVSAVEAPREIARADASAVSGRTTKQRYGAWPTVKVTCESFTSATQRLALENVVEHLRQGGYVGFAADADNAWCSYLRYNTKRAATSLVTGGNVWWTTGAGTIADGDVLAVETANPDGQHQLVVESGGTASGANTITVGGNGLVKSVESRPAWVRHELYWPALYLPESEARKPLLRSDARFRFHLDLTLRFDLAVMAAAEAFDGGQLNLDTSTIAAQGKPTLEQLLQRNALVFSSYTAEDIARAKLDTGRRLF